MESDLGVGVANVLWVKELERCTNQLRGFDMVTHVEHLN